MVAAGSVMATYDALCTYAALLCDLLQGAALLPGAAPTPIAAHMPGLGMAMGANAATSQPPSSRPASSRPGTQGGDGRPGASRPGSSRPGTQGDAGAWEAVSSSFFGGDGRGGGDGSGAVMTPTGTAASGIGGARLVMLQNWVCCGDLSQLSRAHFIYMRVFNKFNAFDIAVIYGCVGRAAAGSWGMLRIG